MNEATDCDLKFMREYTDAVDVVGVDKYPVKETIRDVTVIGNITKG